MHQSSLEYLRCVNCVSELDLEDFDKSDEVVEGFLVCPNCESKYPIVSRIAILWPDLLSYLSNRAQLGGALMLQAKTPQLKSFIKTALKRTNRSNTDVTQIEKRWVETYKRSIRSRFYNNVKKLIQKLPKSKTVLEHGCSIGYITRHLAKKHDIVFGIDQSFFAISEAKKNNSNNLDFFVANSLKPPFGKKEFEMVFALNVLELIEPLDFLNIISSQVKGVAVISDPYDFERGQNSVKNKVDPQSLRSELKKHGFKLIYRTVKPSFLPWKLNVNSRLSLNYKVDLIIAKN